MTVDELRKRIDSIDDRIVALLEERAAIAADLAKTKRHAQLPMYDPERERIVMDRLAARVEHLSPDSIRAVYREVMSACLAMEEMIKVAFLGPVGTFTHAAARTLFGLAARYVEAATIEGVFDAVKRGAAKYGVVPIENSSEGSVTHAIDALAEGGVRIRREVVLEVTQCLLSTATGLTEIERVYSHPQALAQCRIWLAKNLSSAQLVQTSSTTTAVRAAAADPRAAAIASRFASETHSMPILRERIQDHPENMTRFLMLSNEDAPPTGDDKTTLVFSLTDERGALREVVRIFDDLGINLTRIESRPNQKKAWEYVFVVDVEGHVKDEHVARAIAALQEHCPMVRHLGSYPRWRPFSSP